MVASPVDRLPPELITYILESLDQADLRSGAAVSRRFYGSAWRAGLYIHRNIQWRKTVSYASLNDIVHHAREKGLRLSLSLNLQDTRAGNSLYHASSSPIPRRVMAQLPFALPVLVYLSISIADSLVPALSVALSHPAPLMTYLRLSADQREYSPFYEVPVGLFLRSAPMLRRLELKDIALGSHNIPAFSLVDTVSLDYAEHFPEIDYAHHFPRLRDLSLVYAGDEEDASPPNSFGLAGVQLRKLRVEEYDPYVLMPAILRSANLGAIERVEYTGGAVNWGDPLWNHNDDGSLSVCLRRHVLPDSDISITILPAHGRWRRVYNMHEWALDDAFPVAQLPGLSRRLTCLHMGNKHIASLLECNGMKLEALRELRIDFDPSALHSALVWPPNWLIQPLDGIFSFGDKDRTARAFSAPSYSYVCCDALETLTLLSPDRRLSVASLEIAFLGRALLCAPNRTTLVLSGIKLRTPIAQTLLDQTFSGIREHTVAVQDSLSDFSDDDSELLRYLL